MSEPTAPPPPPSRPRRRAAALRYARGTTPAPEVVARGEGYVADAIVEAARRHGVPVHHGPHLVELLTRLPLDEAIPPALYRAVAEVLVFLMETDARRRGPDEAGPRATTTS